VVPRQSPAITNEIFVEAAQDLDLMVLAYEIWGLLSFPNAFVDVTDVLDRKREMIVNHASQTRTVDYVQYAEALADAGVPSPG
jgi:hypothetical protein